MLRDNTIIIHINLRTGGTCVIKNKRKLEFQPPLGKKLRKLQIRPTAIDMVSNFHHRSRSCNHRS